mgnify:CR=1 FL=1
MLRFTLVFAVVLVGCQTLSPEAGRDDSDSVRIVEDEAQVANCARVEEVAVAAPFRFLTQAIPESASIGTAEIQKTLRYQTRLVGGDTVLQRGIENGLAQGMAYDCR